MFRTDQYATMTARMLRAVLVIALAAALMAPALALDVPALSAACLADRTQGCCPGGYTCCWRGNCIV